MKTASSWSVEPEAVKAVTEAYNMLIKKLHDKPHLLLIHSSCEYDSRIVLDTLNSLAHDVPIQGGTSGSGVMTEEGYHSHDGLGLGLFGIYDPDGNYGTGFSEANGDPATAARSAVEEALNNADRPGEVPAVVIITNYPGDEHEVIIAIEEYIGTDVPIIGGTSADNDMSGKWMQFAGNRTSARAVSIAVLFPSCDISYAFHGGYEPTEFNGCATRVTDRVVHEIDGRPAALVYNEWTGGLIKDVLPEGGSLVPLAGLTPVGNMVGQVGGIPYYRLSYPAEVVEDQALLLFTDVEEGVELVLMRGTPDSIVLRPGRVAESAIEASSFTRADVVGSLVIFCTGCMMEITGRMDEPVNNLNTALGGTPFLTAFTLGEQGCFLGGENRHGNLMIAVLTFGYKTAE